MARMPTNTAIPARQMTWLTRTDYRMTRPSKLSGSLETPVRVG